MSNPCSALESSLVLVVDDDESTRFILREALTHSGFSVQEARDGKEGIAAFEMVRPDIVLLDVMMPDMNGFEVCREIRAMRGGQHLPIIMVTGVDDIQSIKLAYEVGATDFVTKPINIFILSERLRYMLRANRTFAGFRRSEARLAKAQQIARMGSWELDLERKEFHSSDETYRICGTQPESSKPNRKALMKFIHPDDRGTLMDAIGNVLKQGKTAELDHRIVLPNQGERIVSHKIEVIYDEKDEPLQLIGTVQDISERKRAELLEAERNHILEMVISGEPLKNILMGVVGMVEQQRPDATCSLFLLQGNQLFVGATSRMPLPLARALDGVIVGPKNGCCGACAYLGQRVVVPDIKESPLWENCRDLAVKHDIRASFSVPILSGRGRILGTITLYCPRPGQPARFDHSLLEMASKLVAVAIEQRQLAKQLAHQAHHDALTGLPNRILLGDRLEQALAQAQRYKRKVAVIYIDLDRFKHINDFLGHHMGDLLLKEIAERLRICTRKSDTLARMGGDEFMLVLGDISDQDDVSQTGQRLLDVMKEPIEIENHEMHISASIGISIFPDDGEDPVTLQRHADIAMYCAKNDGGNRYQYFTEEMHAVVVERLELENDLRKALERGEFELHFQPQYEMKEKTLIGVEALIRWNHPELGCIAPGRFIPIAEETGLIVPIGAWVLKEACRRNVQWQSAGYRPFKIAVNVSAVQLAQADFPDTVAEALEETGMDPRWLELEITESVLMKDVKSVAKSFTAMRAMGVSIAIDDFGNGYSAMSYLQWLPVDCLKIDQSFVQDLGHLDQPTQRATMLIKAFVNLAANLGLKLLAEGVESTDQCNCLQEAGCDLGQGFLFSVPMTACDIEELCQTTVQPMLPLPEWLQNKDEVERIGAR